MIEIICTLEGRMGSGKTLTATALAYAEYMRREILISAIEAVVLRQPLEEAVAQLREKYHISEKVAIASLQEASKVYEVEGDEAYREHLKVICNNHLNFPYVHFDPQYLIEHMDDEELEDCILILDEAFQVLDSRTGMRKSQLLFTYFLGQTRKRGVDLYVCAHHIDEVDKRLRRKPDIRGTCRYNKGPVEEHLPIHKRRYNWATTRFRDLRTGADSKVKIYGPAFYSLYDTRERIALSRRQMEIAL